jgi:subtilisin family serine protease
MDADNWFAQLRVIHQVVDLNRSPDVNRVKVALLDTGIDCEHPDIKAAITKGNIDIKSRCVTFSATLDPKVDQNGHGTFCASILLKTAPEAALYIARVADDNGRFPANGGYESVAKVSSPYILD